MNFLGDIIYPGVQPVIPAIAMVLVIRKDVKAEKLHILWVGLHTFTKALKLIPQFPGWVDSLQGSRVLSQEQLPESLGRGGRAAPKAEGKMPLLRVR